MAKYTKKPVTIDAILAGEVMDGASSGRFAESTLRDGETLMPQWVIDAFTRATFGFESVGDPDPAKRSECVIVNTHHGQARAERGDWIIRGVDGELYPCKPDVFARTYEPEEAAMQVLTLKGHIPNEQFKAFREKWEREVSSLAARTPILNADLFGQEKIGTLNELLDTAWGIIANAGGGNWDNEKPEWKDAAIRWREQYHASLDMGGLATDAAHMMAEAWNRKVERIHAQEKIAVESGWVENPYDKLDAAGMEMRSKVSDVTRAAYAAKVGDINKPEPPPVRRDDLRPAWDSVIEEFRQRYTVGDYLTDPMSAGVVRDVLDDMTARDQAGRLKYGVPLTAFNGRDQLVDAYQEALDLSVYLRAAQDEGISGASAVYSNTLHNIFWLRVAINGRAARAA